MPSYVIDQILKSKKITDYLSQKGHEPVGQQVNGKLRYRCPLHEGDRTPSFMVYTNGEFENFFCYGCRKRYNIIHLYRDIENVSIKEAIKALSNGLDLDIDAEISHAIREIESDNSVLSEYNPPQLALLIGRQLYEFVLRIEKDQGCVNATEKMLSVVDGVLETGDFESLKTVYDSLPDVLLQKIRDFDAAKEMKLQNAIRRFD